MCIINFQITISLKKCECVIEFLLLSYKRLCTVPFRDTLYLVIYSRDNFPYRARDFVLRNLNPLKDKGQIGHRKRVCIQDHEVNFSKLFLNEELRRLLLLKRIEKVEGMRLAFYDKITATLKYCSTI